MFFFIWLIFSFFGIFGSSISKGVFPTNKTYIIIATAHISTSYECFPSIASGAIYVGVPKIDLFVSPSKSNFVAKPKSPSFNSILSVKNKFPNFKSL